MMYLRAKKKQIQKHRCRFKKLNRPILVCLISYSLLIVPIIVHSAVTVKVNVDKNKITIGDKIVYTVIIEHDAKDEVKFPELGTNLDEFEIKDYKVIGPKKKFSLEKFSIKKKIVTEYRYVITTFTTGEFKIPALIIEYTDEKGEKKQTKSDEKTVFVESVKSIESDKGDIRNIKTPVSVPIGWLLYFLLIFIPLVVGLGIAGYYYYQNKKKKDIFAQSDLNRPADEVAYERLEKLNNLNLIASGRIKEYYIILSEIMRKYLEQRYSISVLDRTTNELYRELREKSEIDKKHCTLIKQFLEDCDLVKFAKFIPEEKTVNENRLSAKNIIDLTKPAQQVSVVNQEKATVS